MIDNATTDSTNVDYVRAVMRDFGFENSFALLQRNQVDTVGMSRVRLLEVAGTSAMLLNVMGYVDDPELLAVVPRRVFLDIDPGFPQMWRELGLHDAFRGYDDFVTIGEKIADPACEVPTCGLDWITTTQPVVLEHWPPCPGGEHITSVATWRGPFDPIDFAGKRYGLRVHELRRFVALPGRTRASYELALSIDPSEQADLALLAEAGWSIVDPLQVAGDPGAFRRDIQGSAAELMVAKNMYVETVSGWFSDRSACYLASGKPVLAQDTGLQGLYPIGRGLLTFSSLEEAVAGVEELLGNYEMHARAARELACEYLDSDKVLTALLERLGVG